MVQNSNKIVEVKQVKFLSSDVNCSGDLYLPQNKELLPIIIMAHGLGGTRNMRLPAYAERFSAAGYACLLFDYRSFGDSEGSPRQIININNQLEDWISAVNYVRELEKIDPSKVILWGSSFSGGHVLSIASEDKNIVAVIAQGLFTDGIASSLSTEPLVSIKLGTLGVIDRLGSLLGAKPIMIPVVGRAGETALMTAPDAYDGYFSLIPEGANVINLAAARVALDILSYQPGKKVIKIKAPVLFQVCNKDSVAPAKQTLKYARKTSNKEIKQYDYGHFEIYTGGAFENLVSDQLEFLSCVAPISS